MSFSLVTTETQRNNRPPTQPTNTTPPTQTTMCMMMATRDNSDNNMKNDELPESMLSKYITLLSAPRKIKLVPGQKKLQHHKNTNKNFCAQTMQKKV